MPETMRSGILLVDKSGGITSHGVVAAARRLLGTRKVGHAGTLDPMATGLLVLGAESATRLLTYVVGLDKEYLATIRLGMSTTTDDREGEPLQVAAAEAVATIDPDRIDAVIAGLTGEIEQVPSTVSAIKVDGKRAYALARAGETVELASRRVTVSGFEVLARRAEPGHLDLDVRVVCSSGTYIRALARDLGAQLGVGGHLTALRRTRIGPFHVDEALTLDALADTAESGIRLLGPTDVAGRLFPIATLDTQQSVDLGHGKRVRLADVADAAVVAAVAPDGRLIGLVEVVSGTARTLVNFPPDAAPSQGGTS